MVFVKEHEKSVSELKDSSSETKEKLELANFLREFQDIFIDNIPGEMPPSRGMDDHSIDLIWKHPAKKTSLESFPSSTRGDYAAS